MATEEIILPTPGAIPGIAGGVQPAGCVLTLDWTTRQVVRIAPLPADEDAQAPARVQQAEQETPPAQNGG